MMVTVLAAVALAAAGCGDEGETGQLQPGEGGRGSGSGGDILAAADVERVVRAQREIAACRSGQDRRGVEGAATTLVAVYREGPELIFQFGSSTREGRPMREVLQESASGLRRCGDERALAIVEQALRAEE
jgi:hypothetical protein